MYRKLSLKEAKLRTKILINLLEKYSNKKVVLENTQSFIKNLEKEIVKFLENKNYDNEYQNYQQFIEDIKKHLNTLGVNFIEVVQKYSELEKKLQRFFSLYYSGSDINTIDSPEITNVDMQGISD